MLEKLKALGSKSKAKGAMSRTLKQSFVMAERKPLEIVAPEVQKVLATLAHYENGIISYDDIARGSGVPKHRLGKIIGDLVKGGAVVRSKVPRQGTRYQIIGGSPNPSKVTEDSSVADSSEQNDIDFVKTSEELINRFVRATRTTDIYGYLTWLERGGN